MSDLRQVLKRPVITEKSTTLNEANNTVAFVVSNDANKLTVKRAVEDIFKVKVENVRTINVAGKVKRAGGRLGKRSNWKKAYVVLKAGESIDVFEGV